MPVGWQSIQRWSGNGLCRNTIRIVGWTVWDHENERVKWLSIQRQSVHGYRSGNGTCLYTLCQYGRTEQDEIKQERLSQIKWCRVIRLFWYVICPRDCVMQVEKGYNVRGCASFHYTTDRDEQHGSKFNVPSLITRFAGEYKMVVEHAWGMVWEHSRSKRICVSRG